MLDLQKLFFQFFILSVEFLIVIYKPQTYFSSQKYEEL